MPVAPDIACLREPNLLVHGEKPIGPVRLNQENWIVSRMDSGRAVTLSPGIATFQNGSDVYEYRGQAAHATQTDAGEFERNVVVMTGSASDGALSWDTSGERLNIRDVGAGLEQTLIIRVRINGYGEGGYGRFFENGDEAFFLRRFAPFWRFRDISGGVIYDFTSMPSPVFGDVYTIIYRSTGTSFTAMIADSNWASQEITVGRTPSTPTTLYIGNRPAMDRALDGELHCIINDHRRWSDVEVDDYLADPYQFLIPA